MRKENATFLKTTLFVFLYSFTFLWTPFAQAQGSMNMTMRDNWDGNNITNVVTYNDVWGYVDDFDNEYAIVGSPEKVHFIDVTNPDNVVFVNEFSLGESTIWRDFKSYDRYVYAVADQTNEGLAIFNMSALPTGPVSLVYQSNSDFGPAHNIYIDVPNGRLYVVGLPSNPSDMLIYDLTADPANPTLIGSHTLPGGYIHDVFVQDNIAYASSEDRGLYIYDVSDASNPVYQASLVTGAYNHSSWIYEDGTKVIYAEESSGEPLGIIDITNAANDDITLESTFMFPLELQATGDARLVYHNPFILGNYAIVSSYYDGVTIIDITDPNNTSLAGYYDTFSNNGYAGYAADGCWGVYPYLPSGNIIGVDTETGLYVLSTTVPLPATRCNNGIQDAFEEGVDCGGFCKPCGTPIVPTCSDGIQNGDETGVDCGGTTCSVCPPTCTDGIQNGDETDIDCGGTNCVACPSCSDGILNGDEIGVDCGGETCPTCPPEDCSIRDFNNDTFVSYDDQDNGTATVLDNGATVSLAGNAWKAIQIDYPITPNTVLEFDFRSDTQGEIHEISFDTDLSFSPDLRLYIHGTDVNNTPYTGSGNYEHFTFSIGTSLPSGTMAYLLLTCDDDANAAGDSYFRNIQIYEDYNNDLTCGLSTCDDGIQNGDEIGVDCGGSTCPACPSDSDCSIRDFTNDTFVSYDNQDNGTATVLDNGATVSLAGNAWKAIQIDYPITPNTVLEFDFRSDTQGEIHEISFDTDLSFSPDLRLYIHGTDVNNTPYTGSGNYEHFTFSIGTSLPSGTMAYLLLTCDDDANAAGDSYFRNIQIYEDYDGSLTCNPSVVTCPVDDTITGTLTSNTYQASNAIISTAIVPMAENVSYSANLICLDSGFEVELGAEFLGEINPCTPFIATTSSSLIQSNKQHQVNKTEEAIRVLRFGNSSVAYIQFYMEEAGQASIELEDKNGVFIKTIFTAYAKKGHTRFRVDASEVKEERDLVLKVGGEKIKSASFFQ